MSDLCNCCGKTCIKIASAGLTGDLYGLIGALFSTGYLSDAFPDGVTVSFNACEECLASWFKTFKIEPKMQDYM